MEGQQVVPEHVFEYEAAVKEFLPLLVENDYPVPFMAFQGEDMTYYYATPIEKFADIEQHRETWSEFAKKVGMDKIKPHLERFTGTSESSDHSIWRHRTDLSLSTDPPKFNLDESPFRYWGFLYVKPGMEQQFEAFFKKFADLFKAKEIVWGWDTWVCEFGANMPVYVYAEHAPGPGVFWTEAEKIQKMLGEDTMKLWAEMLGTVRDFEIIRTTYREDLSYSPKAEAED
jgi:hypothetical protein